MPPEPQAKREYSPLLFLCAIAVINIGVPFLPVPNAIAAVLGGIFLTVLYVGAVVAFGLSIARKQFPISLALALLGVCVLVWLGAEFGFRPWVRAQLAGGSQPTTLQQLLGYSFITLRDLAMMAGSSFAGTILARMIRHPNMLGPIGAAIALIDTWGVLFGGIVSQLLSNKAMQPIAERAMTSGPRIGAVGAVDPRFAINIPQIGMGDFLFITLLLSVVVNLEMNWKTSARLMWIFITLALLSVAFLPWVPHLPGLLFIAAAVVLPNLKYFRFTREEQFALLYAGIFVLILTVGLYFGFMSMLPAKK